MLQFEPLLLLTRPTQFIPSCTFHFIILSLLLRTPSRLVRGKNANNASPHTRCIEKTEMGSLVMSQVAPGLGQQHAFTHHIMVGGDAQHNEQDTSSRPATSRAASQPQQHTSRSATATGRPPSPPLPPTSTPSNAHARPTVTSRQPSSLNQHQHGFDQSGFPLSSDPRGLRSSPSSPRLGPTHRSTRSLGGSEATSPSRLKVRDLAHIQSFASQEYLARPRLGPRHFEAGRQYEISSMPVTDIIEMVAGLLTRITTTNDRQHEHIHRPATPHDGSVTNSTQSSCVLAFHGKNVPSITILSYLSRIHKYCPTTYEVFLSLLVYFDRMTDHFNKRFLQKAAGAARSDGSDSAASEDTLTEDNVNSSPSMNADDEQEQSQFFVVDSYNIHRLVIAGVTCASKFFSDVFYTNSRYAKVCDPALCRSCSC